MQRFSLIDELMSTMCSTVQYLPVLNQSQGGICICGALKIGLDATVKLFRLYLENDPVPSTDFMQMHISPWY